MAENRKAKKKTRFSEAKWSAKDRVIKRNEAEDELAELRQQNTFLEEELTRQGKDMMPRIERLERENKKLESQLKQLHATEEFMHQTLSKKEGDIEDLRGSLKVLKPTYETRVDALRKETEERLGILVEGIGDIRDFLNQDHGLEPETKLKMERKLKVLMFLMGAKEEDVLRSCNKTRSANAADLPEKLEKASLEKQLISSMETVNQLKRNNAKLGKDLIATKQKLTRESMVVSEQKVMINYLKTQTGNNGKPAKRQNNGR
ncbi:predicted protein [Nematostella vectensis]|uniref:Uncharacterized protein n=1 Tax=Nematostella vectensis TaxID=45351 RepID=A7RNT0_NEMVE|nr:predicted protein [Nematostella vectensis]|eukprot:XP_001638968.1 predicted protein [Nematostella vectensis]